MPDLAEIAQSSGLPVRKLRYVLDHRLLPGTRDARFGRGTARAFTPFEAFSVVVAALMLHAGLRRALVRDAIAVLSRRSGRDFESVPLYKAFAHGEPATLELADWKFVRLTVAERLPWPPFDSDWLALDEGQTPGHPYAPLIRLVLDVGQIRRLIPGSHSIRIVESREPDTEVAHPHP